MIEYEWCVVSLYDDFSLAYPFCLLVCYVWSLPLQ